MCGVIVVDAGRSRSTYLGCDAYIMIIADYSIFYQLPNSNLFTHRVLLMREATSESYGPRVYFSNILLSDLSFCFFLFTSTKPKTPKHIAAYFICPFYFVFLRDLSLPNLSFYRREIDNLSFMSGCKYLLFVCRCCLLGGGDPPTGSITLVS